MAYLIRTETQFWQCSYADCGYSEERKKNIFQESDFGGAKESTEHCPRCNLFTFHRVGVNPSLVISASNNAKVLILNYYF